MNSVKLGQSLTVIQFQRLLGLMAAVSNEIYFGLLYITPLQWWLKTKGGFPKGQPALRDQGYTAMLTCLRHVEETLVPVTRSSVGGSLSLRNANDRCLTHMVGSGREWLLCPGSVGRPPSHIGT